MTEAPTMARERRSDAHSEDSATISTAWLQEPVLSFAGQRLHVDVKTGIARYGPASLGTKRHPETIRLGYIGSGRSIDSAQAWFARIRSGVLGDPAKKVPDFPGFAADRGFFSELVSDDNVQLVTTNELAEIRKPGRLIERFVASVQLISEKVRLLATQDQRPDVVILALPDELLDVAKKVRLRQPNAGLIVRDLRRALKAELMRHQLPTQILLQRVSEAKEGDRNVDHLSRVAWNLSTSLFYKAGGIPWRPVGLRSDTCYVGISFHRSLQTDDPTVKSSIAQAFDDEGVGLILRGPDVRWDFVKDGPSPHLDAEQASQLLQLVLKRYAAESHRPPARVVIHKTSRYWPDERAGFENALKTVTQYDLVALSLTSELRLVRAGLYPPLRGTYFSIGDLHFLYTTGFIPALLAYPHGHVPAPVQIADHYGDSSPKTLAEEILVLTKMNWNSAVFAGALPITIRFSRQVGDIMRELPPNLEPMPQFKFYT